MAVFSAALELLKGGHRWRVRSCAVNQCLLLRTLAFPTDSVAQESFIAAIAASTNGLPVA